MSKRRLILVSVILVLLVGVAIGVRGYQNSFGVLRVSSDNNFELSLFVLDSTESRKESSSGAVRIISSKGDYKLKKGEYSYKINGGPEYEPQEGLLTLDENEDIKVELSLTPQRLAEIKEKEQGKVVAALSEKYPAQMKDYSLGEGRVFGKGDWYFGVLAPKASREKEQDDLIVILQNKNGSWQVVTDPPSIIVSRAIYPNIPNEIFDHILSRFTEGE